MVTTTLKIPDAITAHFRCKLLHKKRSEWDGTYKYDEIYQKYIPNIKWVCDICDQSKAALHDN